MTWVEYLLAIQLLTERQLGTRLRQQEREVEATEERSRNQMLGRPDV